MRSKVAEIGSIVLCSSETGDTTIVRHDHLTGTRSAITLHICVLLATLASLATAGETDSHQSPRHVARSEHFLVHTDLPPAATELLIERLEKTLAIAIDYWRLPTEGIIECYVVDKLDNWPDESLPHPIARLVVKRIGGITLIERPKGNQAVQQRVLLLAASREGLAEHEVVHAYCASAFGRTGPTWYREGIAQLFTYGHQIDKGMQFPEDLMANIDRDASKSIQQMVKGLVASRKLAESLDRKINQRQDVAGLIPMDAWSKSDKQDYDNLTKEYAWSWLACHMLYHNPNYQSRFKQLGQGYLADQEDRFEQIFGPVAEQLAFEYEFTVRRFAPGYRVDLCSWDWEKRFQRTRATAQCGCGIHAARGYQPSGLYVQADQDYRVKTCGTWKTSASRETTADGDRLKRGSLEGVILKGNQLTEPFLLGEDSSFRAPCDGQLYLRCRDSWAQLSDNDGSVVVSLQHFR